jgi:ribosome-binding factor A
MVIENTMVVYDRALRRINWYSYPEFEFLKDEEIDYHFQDFIFLNEIGHVFAISDDLLD